MTELHPGAIIDDYVPTAEDPCAGGTCQERLCGRMKRELRYFSFLAEEDLEEVAGYFECRQVAAGQFLWREGEPGGFAAFIVTGRVELSKRTEFEGNPLIVGLFSSGALLGESALLDDAPRAETALVMDRADFILLTRESYRRLVAERPALGVKLLQGMLLSVSTRLKKSFDRLAAVF
jgi:CRP/FNR family cyclic AMP-dependent transcriptional regulator